MAQPVTIFDTANQYEWTFITSYNDEFGRLDTSRTVNDDGSSVNYDVDQASEFQWSTYTEYYDTLGRLSSTDSLYDDGSSVN